jgi:hypothetical protein
MALHFHSPSRTPYRFARRRTCCAQTNKAMAAAMQGLFRNSPALLTRRDASRQLCAAEVTAAGEVTSRVMGTILESLMPSFKGFCAAA